MAHPSAFRRVLSAAAIVAAVPALAGPVYTTYFFESLRPAALGTTHAAGILCSPGPLDCQLWITDGTIGGTRAVPSPLGEAIPRRDVISVGNAVYFIGLQRIGEGPVNEDRVWRTDGTTAGTRAVTNGFPPQAFRKPAAAGSTLVYITTQGLWRTNGGYSGTFKIADLVAGEQEQDLASAGGFVYFGKGDIDHGGEVWRTDGTIAGTAMWMDVNLGSASSNASGFKQANGKCISAPPWAARAC